MENLEKVVNYANGITAFYNYLCGNFGALEADVTQIEDLNYIRNAKVALIALFFTTKKEEIVEQETLTNFSSKIIDESLIQSIEMVATKVGDTYKIGVYEEKNPANMVAFIRNSFAHGRYHLDVENNKVIIDNRGIVFDIDIDKLFGFVCGATCSLLKFPKTKKISRIHSQNQHFQKLGFDKITNRKEAEIAIKTSLIKTYTLFSLNDEDISIEALDCFERLLHAIKSLQDDDTKITFLVEKFKKVAAQHNLELMITKKRVKGQELEDVLDLLDRTTGFYEQENKIQQFSYILYCLVDKKDPEYQKEGYLNGLISNMILLQEMERTNNFDLKELIKEKENDFFTSSTECFVSSLIAIFNARYTYPLETSYTKDNAYNLDRSDEFDFGKLDLDFLNPSLIEINMSLLNEQEEKLLPNMAKIEKAKQSITVLKGNLDKARLKNNQKGITFLENKIKEEQEALVDVCFELNEDLKIYEKIKDDYKLNEKYYRNRAIIEGLRNSIAHGHVRIKRFESTGDIDDTVINFKDIYKGKLTFELSMTLKELEKLINLEVLLPTIEYLVEKDNLSNAVVVEDEVKISDDEFSCEVNEEKNKDNFIKRLIKKVRNFNK